MFELAEKSYAPRNAFSEVNQVASTTVPKNNSQNAVAVAIQDILYQQRKIFSRRRRGNNAFNQRNRVTKKHTPYRLRTIADLGRRRSNGYEKVNIRE